MKAITYCLNRFDAETKESFMDLYTKVDENATKGAAAETEDVAAEHAAENEGNSDDLTPF